MEQALINKYNIPVPRYTSYPPANFFNTHFTPADFLVAVKESNTANPQHISVYIHFPFCPRLCYYCGCNSYIKRTDNVINAYINALKQEMKRVFALIDKNRKIAQIHWGGGTPSSLPGHVLKEINTYILQTFVPTASVEIAIECHPGYLDKQGWESIIAAQFNRVSIGVQDFNTEVLKAVNRKPAVWPIAEACKLLRTHGMKINLDFIYGLPLQTTESIKENMQQAIALQPDRIVTFSYAHVPWVNAQMTRLEKIGLPHQQVKQAMFQAIQQVLLQHQYYAIGMDHFVKKEDSLYAAAKEKTLHRNFQGYCTQKNTGQVYAFGVSAISQLHNAYAQNTKEVDSYITEVNAGNIPVVKGYKLSLEQQITRDAIAMLMCNNTLIWQEIAQKYSITTKQVQEQLSPLWEKLSEMEQDGLLTITPHGISVTNIGESFIRNIAALFDPLITDEVKNRFSKPF